MPPAAPLPISARPLVVGLGEILWDLLPGGRQLGGAPTNFAYHAGALGARAAVASAVGDDAPGREILARLDGLGIDRTHVAVVAGRPTGAVDVLLDPAGVPSYTIREGAAWDFIPAPPGLLDRAARADAVCFGSLAQRSDASRETVRAFLAATRPDCLRVFDVNLRQNYFDEAVVRRSLEAADVLKLNDQELPVVAALLDCDGDEPTRVAALLGAFPRLRWVALTRGPLGSSLYAAPGPRGRGTGTIQAWRHAGLATASADTVGAGDAFAAALALGLLAGRPPDRINAAANRLARYVCSQPGATPALPDELVRAVT